MQVMEENNSFTRLKKMRFVSGNYVDDASVSGSRIFVAMNLLNCYVIEVAELDLEDFWPITLWLPYKTY